MNGVKVPRESLDPDIQALIPEDKKVVVFVDYTTSHTGKILAPRLSREGVLRAGGVVRSHPKSLAYLYDAQANELIRFEIEIKEVPMP